jgi:hypothetical protein
MTKMRTVIKIVELQNDFCFKLYSPIETRYIPASAKSVPQGEDGRFHTITEAHNYCERNGIAYQHEWD